MIRISLFIFLLMPFLYLLYAVIIQEVTEPIKYIYTYTGACALTLLFFTTSISLIKNILNLVKYRRMVGLFGFFYALLHFLNFFVFDAEFDMQFVIKESLDKPFVYLGMISFLLLLFMAITSTKELFRKFNKYHKVLYIVLVLTTIHFVMAQKALSILQWIFLVLMLIIFSLKIFQIIHLSKKINSK